MVTDEKLQQIADETGAVFWRITPDGTRVLHVNGNYESVWGRPAEELYRCDQGWLNAVHPDDRFEVENRYFSGLATGDYDAEYRVQRPDGSTIWIHDRGFPVHGNRGELRWIAGLASDVSKRRAEVEALRDNERRLNELFQSLPPTAILDQSNGRLVAANESLCDFAGKNTEQLKARPVEELIHQAEHPVWKKLVRATSRQKSGRLPAIRFKTKRGEYQAVDLETAVLGQQGRIRLTLRLAEADRSPAVGPDAGELEEELKSLAHAVSHDLRAPLRAIDGFSAAVQDDFEDQLGDDGRRMLGVIRTEAVRTNSMLEDLLRLSRLSRHPMEITELDMGDIFESCFRKLAASSPANEVDFHVDPLPAVMGDAFLMRTIVEELLGNALKFSDPERKSKITVTGQNGSSEARFRLTDNGRGIRGLDAEGMFKLFERHPGDENIAGNGSGLAIVKRLIARHRGRVWCEPNADHGATFSFALPV